MTFKEKRLTAVVTKKSQETVQNEISDDVIHYTFSAGKNANDSTRIASVLSTKRGEGGCLGRCIPLPTSTKVSTKMKMN